jgi:uncharacterized protein YbjT (DUF2867 family)
VLRPETLAPALEGVGVAYYLVHSMGRGGSGDFSASDRDAARNFGEAAKDAGVDRLVYLGGLGEPGSKHLRSRHETGEVLGSFGIPLTYFRAAAVIGAGSESFRTVAYLVKRLPLMLTPSWTRTRTQPVAIADVAGALAALAQRDDAPGNVDLGGADVLSYREMIRRTAAVLGRRRPLVLRVPLLTPRLSSYWVALVTPVEMGLVRPLVEGLREEMLVRTPPPPGINDAPMGFDDAVRAALG